MYFAVSISIMQSRVTVNFYLIPESSKFLLAISLLLHRLCLLAPQAGYLCYHMALCAQNAPRGQNSGELTHKSSETLSEDKVDMSANE